MERDVSLDRFVERYKVIKDVIFLTERVWTFGGGQIDIEREISELWMRAVKAVCAADLDEKPARALIRVPLIQKEVRSDIFAIAKACFVKIDKLGCLGIFHIDGISINTIVALSVIETYINKIMSYVLFGMNSHHNKRIDYFSDFITIIENIRCWILNINSGYRVKLSDFCGLGSFNIFSLPREWQVEVSLRICQRILSLITPEWFATRKYIPDSKFILIDFRLGAKEGCTEIVIP